MTKHALPVDMPRSRFLKFLKSLPLRQQENMCRSADLPTSNPATRSVCEELKLDSSLPPKRPRCANTNGAINCGGLPQPSQSCVLCSRPGKI